MLHLKMMPVVFPLVGRLSPDGSDMGLDDGPGGKY